MPRALANRYAHALADAVLTPASASDPNEITKELRAFEAMIREVPELKNVLLSPAVSNARKRDVVARFAESMPLSQHVRNFLYVLVDRRRAGLLDEITDAFEAAVDERSGVVRAEVSSAVPLSDAQRAELAKALSDVTGKRVRCEFAVDDSLIGGVIARIGSTVYDGSVRTQLGEIQQLLAS
jgi:F-type H+-transporting ATPase subunit delta